MSQKKSDKNFLNYIKSSRKIFYVKMTRYSQRFFNYIKSLCVKMTRYSQRFLNYIKSQIAYTLKALLSKNWFCYFFLVFWHAKIPPAFKMTHYWDYFSASAAAGEFFEWVQVGIDVCIHHYKYQVKPHSSPWFSAACAAAIVQRNHFFRLYQQNKSSESKFRQPSNRCKRVLEAATLAYPTKTKESFASQKLGSRNFWQIANNILNKGQSAIPPLFNGPEVLSCAKLFSKNFSKNSNLDYLGISLPVFSLDVFYEVYFSWGCSVSL